MANDPTNTGSAPVAFAGDALKVATDRLILDGQLPDLGVLNRYRDVVIWADAVEARGHCRFIGQNVTIMARRFIAHQAVLDASGAKVADLADDPSLDAVVDPGVHFAAVFAHQFRGQDGRDAPRGNDGGRLWVYAGELCGDLSLRADAAAGGRGQRGGTGGSWARDFVPPADKPPGEGVLAPGAMPESAPYGFQWLTHPGGPHAWFNDRHGLGAEKWVLVHGSSGAPGWAGGAAGQPGRSGRGGNGGDVRLFVLEKSAGGAPRLSAARGPGGPPQHKAHGGLGTVAHSAGRNALYCFFERGGPVREGPFHLGGPDAKLFGALRVSDKAGAPAGPVGATPGTCGEGAPGADGVVELREVDTGTLSALFGRDLVQHLMAQAAEAARFGSSDAARERYLWLRRLTQGRMGDLADDIARSLDALPPVTVTA